jgi:hypothetical protein
MTTATTITVWQNNDPPPFTRVLVLLYDGKAAWLAQGRYDATYWRILAETYGDGCERSLGGGERVLAWAWPNHPDPAIFLEVS